MTTPTETVRLEYWSTRENIWTPVGQPFFNERNAWASLGEDCYGYRTVDSRGNVLTEKKEFPKT